MRGPAAIFERVYEQIATALRQVDAGAAVLDVMRELGISEATYDVWRKRYGRMAIAEIRRLRQRDEENSRLKRMYAEMCLMKDAMKAVI